MLEPFQERVKKEKRDLDEKVDKLKEFLFSDAVRNLPLEDMKLLHEQHYAMKLYSNILEQRISRF